MFHINEIKNFVTNVPSITSNRIIKTNTMELIYLQIRHVCKTTKIKPIVFFDIDDTFCIYSLDKEVRENHDKYVIKILNLLDEENVYFITNRNKDTHKQNTIELLMETIKHPWIHENVKIIFCRYHVLVGCMSYQCEEIPKYKKILELHEKFVPGTWVYFIDDSDKHVEYVYHALKHYKIDFTCFLFDDQNAGKTNYVDIYRSEKMCYDFDLSSELSKP